MRIRTVKVTVNYFVGTAQRQEVLDHRFDQLRDYRKLENICRTFYCPKKQVGKPADRVENGFSVIELIVGLVLFMIVTGAVYGLMKIGLQSRTTVNGQTQLNKTTRISLNLIGRDTYNAGYVYPFKKFGQTSRQPNFRAARRTERFRYDNGHRAADHRRR